MCHQPASKQDCDWFFVQLPVHCCVPAAAARQDFGLSATMRALQQKDKQDDAQGMRLSRSGMSMDDNVEKLWTQKTGAYLSRLDSKQRRGSVILGLTSLKVGSVHPQEDNSLPILLPSKVSQPAGLITGCSGKANAREG